jgi:glucose/arabinose dehydrogenase
MTVSTLFQVRRDAAGAARASGHLALPFLVLAGLLFSACDRESVSPDEAVTAGICDPDNGGLILPEAFCARIVADNIGFVRQIAVDHQGHLYVAQRNVLLGLGGLLVVPHTGTSDTVAVDSSDDRIATDDVIRLSDTPGMGLGIHDGWLYFGADDAIYRYRLPEQGIVEPDTRSELLVSLPQQEEHAGKTFAFDGRGNIYVNIAAPSNACQEQNRVPGSPGMDPCPELEHHAAVWRFALDRGGQSLVDGEKYAGGIRNVYALDWNMTGKALYAVQHGRVQLHELWPDRFSELQNAELPGEEFLRIEQGQTYSWPYCYFDHFQDKLVLGPEYGGDGREVGRCADYPRPLFAFPAHYSPFDMISMTVICFTALSAGCFHCFSRVL